MSRMPQKQKSHERKFVAFLLVWHTPGDSATLCADTLRCPPELNSARALQQYSLLACASSRRCSFRSCRRCGFRSSSGRCRSVARSSCSGSSRRSGFRSGGRGRRTVCRRGSLIAALVARSQCDNCQQGCYEEGFLHDHVLLWLKVSNSANNTGNVPQHRPGLKEARFKCANLPNSLGGNYRHFRIDRRPIQGQYVVFLILASY